MSAEPLALSFYEGPTLQIARRLLGSELVCDISGGRARARIVEVEAYHQQGDEACHAYRGLTLRNKSMFGPPGRLYVYFIYGMHHCMNIVTEPEGTGAAVLIRALEPLQGLALMRRNRAMEHHAARAPNLTNGPAKLCQALGIDRGWDGASLQGPRLWLESGMTGPIACGPRIGISKSTELPWRFWLKDNEYVSRR